MKRLGDANSQTLSGPVPHSQLSRTPLPVRRSICLGDVIAVICGVVVFCLGVLFWVSSSIGLFGGDSTGIQRLAVLTTSLGINTIVICGLLLYSIAQSPRSDRNRPRPTGYTETVYTTGKGERSNPRPTKRRSSNHRPIDVG